MSNYFTDFYKVLDGSLTKGSSRVRKGLTVRVAAQELKIFIIQSY